MVWQGQLGPGGSADFWLGSGLLRVFLVHSAIVTLASLLFLNMSRVLPPYGLCMSMPSDLSIFLSGICLAHFLTFFDLVDNGLIQRCVYVCVCR